jgi:hypothetical protein
MSLQALARPANGAQPVMPAITAIASRIRPINERCRQFLVRMLAAMEESKRKEGARLIRRYSHLIDKPLV